MNKIIIIGASSGIGKEMALRYAQMGSMVGITGRRKELLEEIQSKYPNNIQIACFDARQDDNKMQMQQLISKMGGMDLFIYNAGYGDISKTLNEEIERTTYETNVKGLVNLVAFAFNFFVEKKGGQIAVTSSIAAIRGNSMAPAYGASKAFASNYCEGLSIKARRMHLPLYITDIQPGFVDTKMAKGDGRFWQAPVPKAARQMIEAIDKKKRRVYITRRWALIAWILKWMPYSLLKRVG